MSEQKRQAPISRKEEKRKQEEEEDHVEYVASEQDRQVEASNTKTTIHQDNAIQHVVEGENNTIWSFLLLKKLRQYLRKK